MSNQTPNHSGENHHTAINVKPAAFDHPSLYRQRVAPSTTKQYLFPTPTRHQKIILWQALFLAILVIIMLQFRITNYILYPFSILSTIFHEFSHALMALLTGGRMSTIRINMDESGATRFSGKHICLILPAGYVGSSVCGALLIFCAFSKKLSKWACWAIMAILVMTIYYSTGLFTWIATPLLFACMLALTWWKDGQYCQPAVLFLGVISTIKGILSIFDSTVINTIKDSDAHVFARKCSFLVPASVWGFVWLAISSAFVWASIVAAMRIHKHDDNQ